MNVGWMPKKWIVKSMKNLPEGNTMKRGQMLDKMLVLVTNAHAGQFDRGCNINFYFGILENPNSR